MTNKLRDELASVICFADGVHPDAIKHQFPETYYWQDYIPHAQAVIDHLAPTIREAVEVLEFYADFEENTDDGRYQWHEAGDPSYMMTMDDGEKAQKALASLSAWQEKGE